LERLRSLASWNASLACVIGKERVTTGRRSTRPSLMRRTASANSAWKAEGAVDRKLLGHDHVLRQGDIAPQAQLTTDASRPHDLQPVAQGALVARAFEHDVERALSAESRATHS
jgi:hypothetical protein